jgi:two-component system, NtrC family, sensor histidine kinase PilS
VVIVSAFIYLTGGITSYFSSLYLLPIIAASTLRFRRGALQIAALTSVLYLALVSSQYLHALGFLADMWPAGDGAVLPSTRFAQYTVAINVFGFFAVGLLSGSLAEGLRTAGASLERASTQMADLRAFNELVIDSLLSGLVTADHETRVLTFNRAASVITGVPASDAIGRSVIDLLQLTPADRDRVLAIGYGSSVRLDRLYVTPERRTIDIGITALRLAYPDGRTGLLFTFQDVTDLRRLQRNATIQQRLAAVGEMAAGIAHEIRNPLAAMSGSIQVLRQDLPLNEEQSQLMDIVLRESERLNDTIRSFLAYARPTRFAVGRLDLRKTVQDAAMLLRNGAIQDAHVVEVDVPSEPVWYEADEDQVRQIIWNLATNSLRAMPGGGCLRLSLASDPGARPGGEVVLTVEDEGRGIPAEEVDEIFQPFRSSFEKGTGLGLAIVHRIVTDYGGNIQVASRVGEGTRIAVRLPIRPVIQPLAPAAAAGGIR